MRSGSLICLLLLVLATSGLALPAHAQLELRVGEDGVRTISYEAPPAKVKRTAPRSASPAHPTLPPAYLEPLIERFSSDHGLDPRLVRAVIRAESDYDPRARSRKGAMGLMQLMPATARSLAVADPYDPEQNLRGGTIYLRRLLDRFGRVELALAAYNAGPEAVEKHGGIPPYAETRTYVRRVLMLYGRGSPGASGGRRGPQLYLVRRPGEPATLTTEMP